MAACMVEAIRVSRSRYRAVHPARLVTLRTFSAFSHFTQLLATGGEETAEQTTRAEFLQSAPPALGITPEPIEDAGQFRRDRRLSFAIEPPRVIDQ